MKKILIVEDSADTTILLSQVVRMALKNAEIKCAATVAEATPQVSWADLVITDYEFPDLGFPALLPLLQKEQRLFILHSACPDCLKTYEPTLQLGSICKGSCFTAKMLDILSIVNIRFNS